MAQPPASYSSSISFTTRRISQRLPDRGHHPHVSRARDRLASCPLIDQALGFPGSGDHAQLLHAKEDNPLFTGNCCYP